MEKGPLKNSTDAEKRMHPRSAYVTNVTYRLVADDNATNTLKGEGLTQNISYEGMCLILNQELSPGAIVELKFDLAEKDFKPIEMRAKIVWQKKIKEGFLTGVKLDID